MKLSQVVCWFGVAAVAALLVPRQTQADDLPDKYKEPVRKGLEYLVKQQFKDGHWGANGDQYPVSMTGLAGIAMLMEGSTIREGKYAKEIRKAADWCMDRSMKGNERINGLVGDPANQTETGRYMYGHGFATLFLALVYGEEEDKERREKLKDILTRAVTYIGKAQSTQGGWFYTSKVDGGDNDEGSVTVTQLQPLRACRNAGIPVPKQIIDKGIDYLKKSTTSRGGVVYSLGRGGNGAPVGGERPSLTAAAIACYFSAGNYDDKNIKNWFNYTKTAIPVGGNAARIGHDEYTHYYYAQAVYFLGEDGWDKMFPGSKKDDRVTWSQYKKDYLDRFIQNQNGDGSFAGGGGFSVGPVYTTAIYCTLMQLDRGIVPFYMR